MSGDAYNNTDLGDVFYHGENTMEEVTASLTVAAPVFVGLVVVFEALRVLKPHLHHPRYFPHSDHSGIALPPNPLPGAFPLSWVLPVLTVSERGLLAQSGLDCLMLVRFVTLCLHYCLFGTVLGLFVFTPVFVSLGEDADGSPYDLDLWQGSLLEKVTIVSLGDDAVHHLETWVIVVGSYVGVLHFMALLWRQCESFSVLRREFLLAESPAQQQREGVSSPERGQSRNGQQKAATVATGAPGPQEDMRAYWLAHPHLFRSLRQAHRSVMVEGIPPHLRNSRQLTRLFETLFPRRVHSVVVLEKIPRLEGLLKERLEAVSALEVFNKTYGKDLPDDEDAEHLPLVGHSTGLHARCVRRLWNWWACCCLRWALKRGAKGKRVERELHTHVDRLNADVQRLQDITRRQALAEDERVDRKCAALSDAQQQHGPNHFNDLDNEDDSGEDESREEGASDSDGYQDHSHGSTHSHSHSHSHSSQGPDYGTVGRQSARGLPSSHSFAAPEPHSSRVYAFAATVLGSLWSIVSPLLSPVAIVLGLKRQHKATRASTAFVTFTSRFPVAVCCQSHILPEFASFQVSPAPEPRDILWGNAARANVHIATRTVVVSCLAFVGAIFWYSVVVALVVASNPDELAKYVSFLNYIDKQSQLHVMMKSYLPVLTLLCIMLVLPVVFTGLSRNYERVKTGSGVSLEVTRRHFLFQIANVYVIATAHSIAHVLSEIIDSPTSALTYFGASLPSACIYLTQIILVKTFCGLPLELLRVGVFTSTLVRGVGGKPRSKMTPREQRLLNARMSKPEPEWAYPALLLVFLICAAYAVVAPVVVMPAGLGFFAFARVVYTYQSLYVFAPSYDTGGAFWMLAVPRLVLAVALAQILLSAYLVAVGMLQQACVVVVGCVVLWLFWKRLEERFFRPVAQLSLLSAREADNREAAAQEGGGESFEPDLYVQPALVAPPLHPET